MAKTRSWSVKGIDGETRDLARDAAQASGMTIGAWIDQAILRAKSGEISVIGPANVPAEASAETNQTTETAPPLQPSSSPPVAAPPVEPPVESPVESPAKSPSETRAEITAAPEQNTPPEAPAESPAESPADAAPSTVTAFPDQSNGPPGHGITADSRPAMSPPARPPILRYAVLGIVFAGLLGAGGWLLIGLSSPDRSPTPQKIADAAPAVETAPPPPAASSTTTAVAPTTPDAAATGQTKAAQPPPSAAQTAGTDGLPAELPDAIRTIIGQAQSGNAKAQYNLGMLHLAGRLGKKDAAEAAKWFERAAEQGLANAQFNLGVLYQRGEGVTQDDKLAFFWFQSAAEQNFPQAQHNVATAYAEGKGIVRSYPKAAEWFAKSAAAGLSQSQYSLGALHESGLITGQPNTAEARRWYELALAGGDTRASVRLAVLDAPKLPTQTSATPRTVTTPVVTPPSPAVISRAEIRQIQTLLGRMNFNPGPADGQMGKRTADAIRLYQKFAGMDEDGTPSRELLEDLRAVAETMSKGG